MAALNRTRAVAIHLSICLVIGGLLWLGLSTVWYPTPLFQAVGGQGIFLILLGIDVVLGPLMTFIVFKQDRRKLRFDLTVIGLVQLAALVYGMHTLWQGRPVYVAALGHRFDLIHANEVKEEDLAVAKQNLPRFGPVWVGVKEAEDKAERMRVFQTALAGIDYGNYPQHHAPLSTMRDELLKRASKIEELRKLNPQSNREISSWLAKHGVKDDEVVYQGLKARAELMAVVLNAKTAEVVGIAPFKPWP